MESISGKNIRAIIGLGNPGERFDFTRHNVGFMIVDALAQKYDGTWHQKGNMALAEIFIGDKKLLLVKPLTFMNESGAIMSALSKKGIAPSEILVVHDELEKPFGKINVKVGGSHRGHNGLRSIISAIGPDFLRLRFGIGRPENKADVSDYVLARFDQTPQEVASQVANAITMIENIIAT